MPRDTTGTPHALRATALDNVVFVRNDSCMWESDPNGLLEEWTRRVNDRDLGVLDLYDATAVLVPTFSSRLLNTPEKIREYFTTLCSREELGIELHQKPRHVSPVSGDIRVLSGIYRWRFAVDEELLNFEARFSFVLDLARQAPILHHHSSQIPRML
jgi:hypothetical protein